uniref:NACHT domain-containing protein n=1 Tax=Astyanax mexicanus TaxID=7994 RepID=A0A3B1ICS2_ASTMX
MFNRQRPIEEAQQIHTLMERSEELPMASSQPVDDVLQRLLERHKTNMKEKYEHLFESIKTEGEKTLLEKIHNQFYLIEGKMKWVKNIHEVLQLETSQWKFVRKTPIDCVEIFKDLQGLKEEVEENVAAETDKSIGEAEESKTEKEDDKGPNEEKDKEPKVQRLRTVLTKGIAGIGKTVSVQKFILDWAEGKANQDVDFMFVLPFRELNLIKDDQYSLHELLCVFHPELKDLDPKIYDVCKAVFIFDGLDESRIPLKFQECEGISDFTVTSSVSVLMTNLIEGKLFPSAHIWITSQPAAANQIPAEFINRVTEIQGFTDPQKEEYFRKRISDQDQAQKIISHIKKARSLHIMCHIPVFCWITSTVLQRIMDQDSDTEIPKTLTEMYSHFLLTQINMKKEKYEEKDERDPQKLLESNRTMLLKLAELAFNQLMKGNVMFYEEDLKESGIDITEASVYSGIFTGIFREECVIYQRKVYSFVHLSFQEFLAALYVLYCYQNLNMEVLQIHLDLFLRFLLGISMEANQRILQGLLPHIKNDPEITTEFLKKMIKEEHVPVESGLNFFLCLNEMNDRSLTREVQKYLKPDRSLPVGLLTAQCAALVYVLVNSGEVLDELDLRKIDTEHEEYHNLCLLFLCRLLDRFLIKDSCKIICAALQSPNCPLKELDLRYSTLQDSYVCISCIFRNYISACRLTASSCGTLASALQSPNTTLIELDLTNNDLQDSGVELLSAGLKSSHCKMETLRLSKANLTTSSCEHLMSVLQSVNSSLKYLDLCTNELQDSGVELLSAGLKSSHCKLQTLR